MKQLILIQKELNAPKDQYNDFGKYSYRSAEGIMKAVKPLLGDCFLTISDDVVLVGNRVYIKSTATLKNKEEAVSATAFAREPELQKGMNDAQITGSASSYARKYALNGLFAIDDIKDADTKNNTDTIARVKTNIEQINIDNISKLISEGQKITLADVQEKYQVSIQMREKLKELGIS